jgi:hypothetical protein
MNQAQAALALRYRPGADVLIGDVDLTPVIGPPGPADLLAEQPDADCAIVWQRPSGGPLAGRELLASFHVVHAQARWDEGAVPLLPESVIEQARTLMVSAGQALRGEMSTVARVTARAESRTAMAVDDLERPYVLSTSAAFGPADPAEVSDALRRLAGQLPDSPAGTRVGGALHELAHVLTRANGLPAPGASATARATLARLPLPRHAFLTLVRALTDVDDPTQWPEVTRGLDSVFPALRIR